MQARAAALKPRPWSLAVGESIAPWPTTKGQEPTTIFHGEFTSEKCVFEDGGSTAD